MMPRHYLLSCTVVCTTLLGLTPQFAKAEYIQVIIISHVKTYVASVVGWRELKNTVTAVARRLPGDRAKTAGGHARDSDYDRYHCGLPGGNAGRPRRNAISVGDRAIQWPFRF